jgi:alpha-ketoglutarate-dependent taurine dioxygenase
MTSLSKRVAQAKAFDSNLQLDEVLLPIDNLREMTEAQSQAFISLFNRYGFMVIEHAPSDQPEDQLVGLSEMLGTINAHDRSDEKGIVTMSPDESIKGYLGASADEHPLHTDGAYDDVPPKLLCLQCVQHAESGGDSVIVSGKALYDWIATDHPDSLDALFIPDAMNVKRVGREGTKSIFQKVNGLITLVWRDDFTTTFAPRQK